MGVYMREGFRGEGFWASKHELYPLPTPKPNLQWLASDWQKFLSKLIVFEDSIMIPYLEACIAANEKHKELLAQREEDRKTDPTLTYSAVPYDFPVEDRVVSFRGHSHCRLCGCANGSREFRVDGWAWPEGFRHYVECHGVEPSPDFRAFIEGQLL